MVVEVELELDALWRISEEVALICRQREHLKTERAIL